MWGSGSKSGLGWCTPLSDHRCWLAPSGPWGLISPCSRLSDKWNDTYEGGGGFPRGHAAQIMKPSLGWLCNDGCTHTHTHKHTQIIVLLIDSNWIHCTVQHVNVCSVYAIHLRTCECMLLHSLAAPYICLDLYHISPREEIPTHRDRDAALP